MTVHRKPVLPDPGSHERWWEIELDGDYWDLTLYEETHDPTGFYSEPTVLGHETLRSDAVARDFEQAANTMLTLLDKASAFVGTYHKN